MYSVIIYCVFFDLSLPVKDPALTTTASRRNPFFLTVALSAGGWAWGDMFWDDGESLDTYKTGNYCYVTFVAAQVGNRQSCGIATEKPINSDLHFPPVCLLVY